MYDRHFKNKNCHRSKEPQIILVSAFILTSYTLRYKYSLFIVYFGADSLPRSSLV